MPEYTRKALADKLGVGIETLRYYEDAGIITPPERDAKGYRIYSGIQEREIGHYLEAKRYGFTPKEVRALMERAKRGALTPEEGIAIARRKLGSLERRIAELGAVKSRLAEYIAAFESGASGLATPREKP